jgi:hypothetical protein
MGLGAGQTEVFAYTVSNYRVAASRKTIAGASTFSYTHTGTMGAAAAVLGIVAARKRNQSIVVV